MMIRSSANWSIAC